MIFYKNGVLVGKKVKNLFWRVIKCWDVGYYFV